MTELVKPNFLYVGAAKSGSSWIFECLREHPQVFVPIAKDLKYFNQEYDKGRSFEKYLSYFKEGRGKKAIGELSHDYFCQEVYAERIARHLPDTKIIFCLREPGDQIKSSFGYMYQNQRKMHGLRFFYEHHVLEYGRMPYLRNLKFFYERFPADRILVLFYEDMKNSPVLFLESLFKFLQVDPAYRPNILNKKVNPARSLRFNWRIHRNLFLFVQYLRGLGLENAIGRMKRNPQMVSLLYDVGKTSTQYPIDEVVLEEIRSEIKMDYPEIEKLIGRTLPAEWHKNDPK